MTTVPPDTPLKPQDAVMYALGELKGQMGAVIQSQQAQADVNAENRREHEEFRSGIASLQAAQLAMQATQAPQVSLWQKVSAITSIPAAAGAVIALVLVLTK